MRLELIDRPMNVHSCNGVLYRGLEWEGAVTSYRVEEIARTRCDRHDSNFNT